MDLPETQHDDAQPFGAAPEGERAAAFRRLFDAQFEPIRYFLYRYLGSAEDARDLAHDAFLRLWQQRHKLDFSADLRPYLYGIARRAALDALRHRRVVERYLLHTDDDVEGVEHSEDIRQKELAAAIQQAVDALPPQQRQVITLRWQRQMSYAEIARALGLSTKTVENHIYRAFAHLRVCLAEQFNR